MDLAAGRLLGAPLVDQHPQRRGLLWRTVRTAKASELPEVPLLLDDVKRRGFTVDIAVLDRGYDSESVYVEVESRHARPVIPLRETPAVKEAAPAGGLLPLRVRRQARVRLHVDLTVLATLADAAVRA